MFYKFAPTPDLDIDGMNGANHFRKLFLGKNPLCRLGIYPRFRDYFSLFILIIKHGDYSTDEAEKFIKGAVGQSICYASRRCYWKIQMANGEIAIMAKEEKKYFILKKEAGRNEYYLYFYTSDT